MAIRARSATKRFSSESGVFDVDLNVAAGEVVAIVGASGSGKSTLLALLAGLLSPTSGTIEVLGKPIARLRDHHRASFRRQALGVVLQNTPLISGMSLFDNVCIPCLPDGGPTASERQRAHELLERLGLASRRDSTAGWSGGERQRAAFARALIKSPAVLLLDEPSAHVDQNNLDRMLVLVAEAKAMGRSVVLTTHDNRLHRASEIDTVYEMSGGRLTHVL